jgi:hypothetical protein
VNVLCEISRKRRERMERLTMKREEAGRLLKELGEELLRTGRLTYPSEFGERRDIPTPSGKTGVRS